MPKKVIFITCHCVSYLKHILSGYFCSHSFHLAMTPMKYVQNYVAISSGRLLLYNQVFNRHRDKLEEDDDTKRKLSGCNVLSALGEVMGQPLSNSQSQYFQGLIGWQDSDQLDFRAWSGLCALSERILGPQFVSQTLSRIHDPCQEVEQADFETLPRKLLSLSPDPRLREILTQIREL